MLQRHAVNAAACAQNLAIQIRKVWIKCKTPSIRMSVDDTIGDALSTSGTVNTGSFCAGILRFAGLRASQVIMGRKPVLQIWREVICQTEVAISD